MEVDQEYVQVGGQTFYQNENDEYENTETGGLDALRRLKEAGFSDWVEDRWFENGASLGILERDGDKKDLVAEVREDKALIYEKGV